MASARRRVLAALLGAMLSAGAARAAEQEVTAPGPFGSLAGTFHPADGPAGPVVLILPGSGPTDRDGSSPLGLEASPYRLLAEGLAKHGVASLRVDKRGMFGSAAAVPDANAVTIADYVDDVEAWVETIRSRRDRDCVWLAGHSEGGLVALAAAQSVDHLCGLVLIAAPGRALADVLRSQLAGNPHNRPYLQDMLEAIDTLAVGGSVDTAAMPPVMQQLFAPAVQGFLRDLFTHDPAALIATVTLPVLIVQGGNDLQVTIEDADILVAANPAAERADFPAMNHVLKAVPDGDAAANLASYADPALPLAPGLAAAIAEFVLR